MVLTLVHKSDFVFNDQAQSTGAYAAVTAACLIFELLGPGVHRQIGIPAF